MIYIWLFNLHEIVKCGDFTNIWFLNTSILISPRFQLYYFYLILVSNHCRNLVNADIFDQVANSMNIVQDVIEISFDEEISVGNIADDENNDVEDIENIRHFEKKVTVAMARGDKKQVMVYLQS